MVTILMMSAKIVVTPGLLKIKAFWNKGYDVIISVHEKTERDIITHNYFNLNKLLVTFGLKIYW